MIDFEKELNPAQLEAATHPQGPVLVIAGAGSGKTRTIVYRLAWLVEQGIPPESILLMTFTRKAAQEMLMRTEQILGRPLHGTNGGTFHAFAFSVLRQNAAEIGFPNGFTLMDRSDCEGVVKELKTVLVSGKKIAHTLKKLPCWTWLLSPVTKKYQLIRWSILKHTIWQPIHRRWKK